MSKNEFIWKERASGGKKENSEEGPASGKNKIKYPGESREAQRAGGKKWGPWTNVTATGEECET